MLIKSIENYKRDILNYAKHFLQRQIPVNSQFSQIFLYTYKHPLIYNFIF